MGELCVFARWNETVFLQDFVLENARRAAVAPCPPSNTPMSMMQICRVS